MCAYQPSQVDISGQLRARGIESGARSVADGIDVGFQEYNRNKMLTSQSIAKWEGTVKANPEIAQFLDSANPNAPEAATKAFSKLHKDGAVGLKDAAVLAQFADTYVGQKKAKLEQDQMAEQQKMMAMKNAEATRQAAVTAQLAQVQQFLTKPDSLPPEVAQRMAVDIQRNPFLKMAAQLQQANMTPNDAANLANTGGIGGMTGQPTSAMRDSDAIIYAELAAGKLKPEDVNKRKAELLAAGGRDPGDRFLKLGAYVNKETGGDARTAVQEVNTGRVGFVKANGEFETLDDSKWKPSTLSDTNALLDPPGMEKLRETVIDGERSIRGLTRYLSGFENLEQGAGQVADRWVAAFKTAINKQPLSDEEKATGIQKGRLQAILGGLRTTIVGPGVMTEIDAERILNAVGGDVGALQNQEVVRQLISEVLTERLNKYDSDLGVYNTHVDRKYGGQAGYKRRDRIPVNFKTEKAVTKEQPAASQGWDGDKEKRLMELKAKLGK